MREHDLSALGVWELTGRVDLASLRLCAILSLITRAGTFQRYAKSFCSQLTPLPDGLPLDEAAPILWCGTLALSADLAAPA